MLILIDLKITSITNNPTNYNLITFSGAITFPVPVAITFPVPVEITFNVSIPDDSDESDDSDGIKSRSEELDSEIIFGEIYLNLEGGHGSCPQINQVVNCANRDEFELIWLTKSRSQDGRSTKNAPKRVSPI